MYVPTARLMPFKIRLLLGAFFARNRHVVCSVPCKWLPPGSNKRPPNLLHIHQHEEAIISAEEQKSNPLTTAEASQKSSDALQAALNSSSKITLDHWIPYFTHYESARLCSQRGEQEQAKHHLSLILSGGL
jgi:hypothetical protein